MNGKVPWQSIENEAWMSADIIAGKKHQTFSTPFKTIAALG